LHSVFAGQVEHAVAPPREYYQKPIAGLHAARVAAQPSGQ